jgi:hypothetical protein
VKHISTKSPNLRDYAQIYQPTLEIPCKSISSTRAATLPASPAGHQTHVICCPARVVSQKTEIIRKKHLTLAQCNKFRSLVNLKLPDIKLPDLKLPNQS